MKYILFLAFEYEHYKKPAVIELFADDLLIDSIELGESIGRKDGELVNPYNRADAPKKLPSRSGWGIGTQEYNDLMHGKWKHWADKWSVCEKVFTFEIDDSVLKNKLTLNVINNSNNYTNGFMTKFSWLRFDCVALLPKKYFEDIDLVDKELPDVLGINHGRLSPYDHHMVQDWNWPCLRNQTKYDAEKDDWVTDGKEDFVGNTLTMGDSFRYDFELTEWNDIKVIRPKNVSDRFLNELYCLMDPVFLTYIVKAGLNK